MAVVAILFFNMRPQIFPGKLLWPETAACRGVMVKFSLRRCHGVPKHKAWYASGGYNYISEYPEIKPSRKDTGEEPTNPRFSEVGWLKEQPYMRKVVWQLFSSISRTSVNTKAIAESQLILITTFWLHMFYQDVIQSWVFGVSEKEW